MPWDSSLLCLRIEDAAGTDFVPLKLLYTPSAELTCQKRLCQKEGKTVKDYKCRHVLIVQGHILEGGQFAENMAYAQSRSSKKESSYVPCAVSQTPIAFYPPAPISSWPPVIMEAVCSCESEKIIVVSLKDLCWIEGKLRKTLN